MLLNEIKRTLLGRRDPEAERLSGIVEDIRERVDRIAPPKNSADAAEASFLHFARTIGAPE